MSIIQRFIFHFLCVLTISLTAQSPKKAKTLNNISKVSKDFESHFYEALTQRLIRNYDKAIIELDACLAINKKIPVLFFEKAKNSYALKDYQAAEENLITALDLMPKNEIILKELQQVLFVQQKYNQRISTLKELAAIDEKYKYELSGAYIYTKQYGESLETLNDYKKNFSFDSRIEGLRNRVYSISKDKNLQSVDIERKIQRDKNNADLYVRLFELYQGANKKKEAAAVYKRFQKNVPNAPMLEYVSFLKNIDDGNTVAATESMKKLTSNASIDDTVKKVVLSKFRTYGKQNPNYTTEIEALPSGDLAQTVNQKFFMELTSFQLQEGSTESLLGVYEKNLEVDPNNFSLIRDTLLLQLYYDKNDQAKELAALSLEKYPSQPILYLINGALLVKDKKYDNAIRGYLDGLDYIIDSPEMERAFLLKLAEAYSLNGQPEKAKKYQTKGEKISIN